MSNKDLSNARKSKNDEFYTSYKDIALELKYYIEYFKGKVVYCNCDNPKYSNFIRYFYDNFSSLELKLLISTFYSEEEKPYVMYYDGIKSKRVFLKCNGDFRNDECIDILKDSDIVVTNPPFSLFRQYFNQLIEYDKKFIILGNMNASKYREIFPYIKDNKVWYGHSIHSGDRKFYVPLEYCNDDRRYNLDDKGKYYINVKGVRWFTNLDHHHKPKDVEFSLNYNPRDFLSYDNYPAINVDKSENIPRDYLGYIGVPITFLDKYDDSQFELIDCIDRYSALDILGTNKYNSENGLVSTDVQGKPKFTRIIIKYRKEYIIKHIERFKTKYNREVLLNE